MSNAGPRDADSRAQHRRVITGVVRIVMATGIVSVGAHLQGLALAARGLFALNIAFFAGLWLLTALRLWLHAGRFFADLIDHRRGPGYFTMVAGSAILASQCLLIAGAERAAIALFAVAALLWVLLTYAIFASFTIKQDKPTLDEGIGGAWLLAVVATQSLASLPRSSRPGWTLPSVSRSISSRSRCGCGGGVHYTWTMALIFYRCTFFPLRPGDLSPPYWINMGAMAISTLAGSLLVAHPPKTPLLSSLLPF